MSNIFRRTRSFRLRYNSFVSKSSELRLIASEFFETPAGSIVGSSSGNSISVANITAIAGLLCTINSAASSTGLMGASGLLVGVINGTSNQTGDLISVSSSIIGNSFGVASCSIDITALGSLNGALTGTGDASGQMLLIGYMQGNSSSGGGATSDELYDVKLEVAKVISKIKVVMGSGVGYNITGGNGSIPITTLELNNFQTELISELNKIKIRLIQ